MRIVFALVLLIGLGLAGGAVYMAQQYIGENRAELERERQARLSLAPRVDVFVANRTIRYGELIDKKDVTITSYEEDKMPEGIYVDPALLFPGDGTQLRAALRQIDKFEPVTERKVTDPGQLAGVTSSLLPGERAFAIRVDVTSGVSGFLRPGDTVDIYWTGNVAKGQITKLIETSVRLIAIDQSADSERTQASVARTVTVAINPRQVASLTQAGASGRLTLSLVGAGDESLAEAVEIDQRELLGIVDEVVVEVEEEKVCTIKSRRGLEVIEIPIPCANN